MSEDSSLVSLLDRARSGDDAAREELFTKCRRYVDLVARAQVESWLRTKVDASDLVQQTLLEAHRGLSRFRGTTEAEWLAWLRRILRHNAADFVRHYAQAAKRKAAREVPLGEPRDSRPVWGVPELSDPGESPSQKLLRHERELAVADAVAQLPDDYREVILLRNLERLPFSEVARRMGRSRPAVQMLWLRALRKLQGILKDGLP